MTFPPASMVTIGQYREAARAHRGSPARMIQPVEHPSGCRCEEECIRLSWDMLDFAIRLYSRP